MRTITVLAISTMAFLSGAAHPSLAQTARIPAEDAAGAAADAAAKPAPATTPAAPATGSAPATTAAPAQAPADGPKANFTAEELATRLNASDVCAPLSLDLNDVTSLFGVAIPSYLPIDPNLRWNQNAHTVSTFIENGGTFEATIGIGCQPSSNGVILDFLGLTADKLRLPGTALCAGALDADGRLVGTDCTIEGRIVPYISRTIDLEGRLERALTASVAAGANGTAVQPN
ncbi:hypothetical protein U0C82_13980 [Fulvimarina sp. 2208YS6-2-32]|uniref:Uncharacterized protein n=1 Tax=Fulvimarina uroteuthidis TaxID=3098149 RepID=A0ABU5I580_9HYPH|nr:hypothetical protein [Fulvimarina sp. 2208YS6-2-32]MDY8110247.1 hypothetical protein [Fulvimarina sp. 2208YS6-2-32]